MLFTIAQTILKNKPPFFSIPVSDIFKVMSELNTYEKNGQTYAKVADLYGWKDNPRDIHGSDYKRLRKQIELGEHSPLLVTKEGEVLGGNTRLRAYKELKKEECKVVLITFSENEAGQITAWIDGQVAERTFSTLSQAKLEYAVSHNDAIGQYNMEKLSELAVADPLPQGLYKVNTKVEALEDVIFDASGGGPRQEESEEESEPTEVLIIRVLKGEASGLKDRLKQLAQDFKLTEHELLNTMLLLAENSKPLSDEEKSSE